MNKLMNVSLTAVSSSVADDLSINYQSLHTLIHWLSILYIDFISNISKAVDSKDFSLGVFLDLSKAFDTVYHDILCCKLKHYIWFS